jgi:hypothetical protein
VALIFQVPLTASFGIIENEQENIITFQFYTFFGPLLESEDGYLFLEGVKLREWYFEWIEQIIEFNKDNLEIIKKIRDTLVR